MRLIDADALKEVFHDEYKVSFSEVMDKVIDEQPTIYMLDSSGREKGQEEAWSLARRILRGDFTALEYTALKNAFQIEGDVGVEQRIILKGSYDDVAAKVAEWEEYEKKPKTRAEALFEKFPKAIRLGYEGVNPKGCVSSASRFFGKEVDCVLDAEFRVDCEKCWAMPYGGEFEVSD